MAQAQSLPGFSKSFAPSTIGPGSVSTLTFVITNGGAVPIRGLAFSDPLPAGMTIANPPQAATDCVGGTLDAPAGGSTISFADGGIGGGSTCTVQVDVTSSTPGVHTNISGDLTSDAGNSGPATADLTVATDRPGFSKSFSPATVGFGGRTTLTLTIDNTANAAAASNLTFTDNFPTGMEVASPANAVTTCSGGTVSATAGGSSVSYRPSFFGDATVAAGSSCTVSVDVLGNAVPSLGNTSGDLTSSQPPTFQTRSSGKAAGVLQVTVDQLALLKEFLDDPAPPGGTVDLEFTVLNLNRDFAASGLTFTDDLDATLSGLTAVGLPQSDVCGPGSQISGTSVLTLSGGSLAPEEACTFSVTLQIPAGAASGTYVNTTSEVSGDVGGRPETGDAATDELFIEAAPRLTKEFIDDPAGAGGSVTLEFTLTNTSPDQAATDIAFEDNFDSVLPTASATPAAGFCGAGSTATFTPLFDPPGSNTIPARLAVAGASLDPGASCTFSITLNVALGADGGVYPNVTSAVSATVGGESVSGNPASDDLVVVSPPQIVKEFVDDPVSPGDTVTLRFTLCHDESSPGDAVDVTFSDDLEAALSGLVATGLPQSDVCGAGSSLSGTQTILLTGGSLLIGEACTFDVTLQVPGTAPAGPHTNTTSVVGATVLGVATMGNAASDDLNVAGVSLTKEFIDDPVLPGGTVTVRFTITNDSPVSAATDIAFTDDLDGAVDNMTALGLPLSDVCGAGSAVIGQNGDRVFFLVNGSLAPGASCSFDVATLVPAATPPDVYRNVTSSFRAVIDGAQVLFENAADDLTVASDLLALSKEFVDDPVSPGDPVTLRFTVSNLSSDQAITDIAFSDDLDAALAGLASVSGVVADVCGVGSQVSGASVVSLSGGSLAAGADCTFDVLLQVPASVPLGTIATNTTSSASGLLGGLGVSGPPATDDLRIDFMTLSKSFSGPVLAGDTVTLSFSIENLSDDLIVDLEFSDDLAGVLAGLTAIGLPATDVCGEGSQLSGSSFLTLSEGTLLPGGSCTFSVDLQVPARAAAGSYLNVTSDLTQGGAVIAQPATATLEVVEPADDDGDGVLNGADLCPDTEIPEGVPTQSLKPNRYALVDNDTMFDTVTPPGGGPGDEFDTTDTGGCSCEQIIDILGLGNGHRKFGCSLGAMRNWVATVAAGGGADDRGIFLPRTRK